MFRHIVMLGFKQPLTTQDHDYMVQACAAIRRELPGVIDLRFVANEADRGLAYTHAFVGDFVDAAAHEHYQRAAIHVPLKQRVMELSSHLVVLDCRL
ncbi:Dabb family protein [Bordetella parapertussis]|uniref:Stress-response A/B barrel domain-containing protein n=6 Tax=Bordetella TaxID=517 RepID=K0MAS5_BORPB|nr:MULTISPECIES: Dabb family protein [Bordetella]KAK60698.1 stress responsive A/B barrel domain protein [Bordetella bronchiseptica 980-2]SHQ19706.1 Stress responsive A/B Barrel Domain [Mycobacteroides abscessus subsp. abscessus]AMG86946.1 stress responsive protein [Bordetella bronchiseptica]AOB37730.1 stress responsive protein [Bordetella parapertussis]AUL41691.1 stress responsive protein [Bordetella parapertussis]